MYCKPTFIEKSRFKSICHKGNSAMHFIVAEWHMQQSCYSKQENGEKDAKNKSVK